MDSTTLRLDSDWLRLVFNPSDAAWVDLGVPAGDEAGTWSLTVFADSKRTTTLVTVTGSASPLSTPTAPKIRFSVSSVQMSGLLPAPGVRFRGYWEIRKAETSKTWQRGDFIINGGLEP